MSNKVLLRAGQASVHSPSGESVPEGIDYAGLLQNGVHWGTMQANGNFRTVGSGII